MTYRQRRERAPEAPARPRGHGRAGTPGARALALEEWVQEPNAHRRAWQALEAVAGNGSGTVADRIEDASEKGHVALDGTRVPRMRVARMLARSVEEGGEGPRAVFEDGSSMGLGTA